MKKRIIALRQYPTSGSFHFYTTNNHTQWEKGGCVNTLHRVHFISTFRLSQLTKETKWVVSIPYIGFISFLRKMQENYQENLGSVSIPYIGFISFLQHPEVLKKAIQCSVNTLHRVHFISTFLQKAEEEKERGCQYPTSGSFHFYLPNGYYYNGDSMCQYPTSGSFHFYKDSP